MNVIKFNMKVSYSYSYNLWRDMVAKERVGEYCVKYKECIQ